MILALNPPLHPPVPTSLFTAEHFLEQPFSKLVCPKIQWEGNRVHFLDDKHVGEGKGECFLQVQTNSFLRLRSESGFQDAESESG